MGTDVSSVVECDDSLNDIGENEQRRRRECRHEAEPVAPAGKRHGILLLLREDPTAQSGHLVTACSYLRLKMVVVVVYDDERAAHKSVYAEGRRVALVGQ